MSAEQQARYADLVEAVLKEAQGAGESGIDPSDVARVIADAVEARRPRTRYLVGRDAKVMARLAGILPDRVVALAIISSSTSSRAVTPSGMSSAQPPLSERKIIRVFSN